MYDPFRSITIEAGTIPPPQQEMLRRRRFLRQPSSPPPSSSDEETDDTSRFRVSAHPIAMRSASETSRSSSSDRSARVSEVTSKGKKRSRTRQPEVICFPPPNLGLRDSSTEQPALKLPLSESDLIGMLLKFAKPDKNLENMDFLEVLSKKGIPISPPRWWRAGGYGSRLI